MSKEEVEALRLPKSSGNSHILSVPTMARHHSTRVTKLDWWLLEKLLDLLGNPPFSLVLWSGEEILPRGATPKTRVRIHNRYALYKLLSYPNLHFGDLYSTGQIEVEGDLLEFMQEVHRTISTLDSKLGFPWTWLSRNPRPRPTSLRRARHNIYHHYDLGNAFYQLWLDPEYLQYTCAYYPDPNMSLEQAQVAKMHHICRKLRLTPGEAVVEAGCGWGGLALFMAKYYGVTVKAYNISHEQVAFARERLANSGLEGRVEYIEDDYRNIQGDYDVFVSVGMLEHVGPGHYRDLGRVIDRCLREHGRGLIHSVGRNKPCRMNAWLEKRIFPGAYPPTLGEMREIFEPFSFSILDVENLRLHYAKTLQQWLMRFDAQVDKISEWYDEIFVRAWRLYLAGCSAAFTTGVLQLFQVVFNRPYNNDLPWSRAYLYQEYLP